MKNLEGKQIVHALYGRDGRAQFQPGGGELKTCTGDASLLGGGLTSSARKWYFQHSQ